MIREINLINFNRKPEGIRLTKNREKDRFDNVTLAMESFYIIRLLKRYFMRNKAFKNLYKNINKEDKVTTVSIFMGSPKNLILQYKESNYIEYQIVDSYDQIKLSRSIERTDKILEIISTSADEFEKYIPGVKEVLDEAIDSFK